MKSVFNPLRMAYKGKSVVMLSENGKAPEDNHSKVAEFRGYSVGPAGFEPATP